MLNYNDKGGIMMEPFEKSQTSTGAVMDCHLILECAYIIIRLILELISSFLGGVQNCVALYKNYFQRS